MMKQVAVIVFGVAFLILGTIGGADASLTEFLTFVGNFGYSSDGFGSSTNSGVISASVPVGATVLGAYLYSDTWSGDHVSGATLNGVAVAFGPPVLNTSVGGYLASKRADVTAIVKPIIDAGAGGIYDFALTEIGDGFDNVNGEALIVVYSHPSLPVATVGILDGFSDIGGDATAINFADPLHPAAPGFFAEMIIGSSHSCCGQRSTISVNGTVITENAGDFDDGLHLSDGSLITVGGFNDPFSPFLPSYEDDHERYNLVSQIADGDTSINVRTHNPSADDNIFLALFHVFGRAGINEPPPPPTDQVIPEPSSLLLLGSGLAFAGFRKKKRVNS